jgi:toxin-antitoxin system PIN domain toxin
LIAVDTNIVVYAHRSEFPQHERATAALHELAAGPAPWGLPVFVVGEFLRIVTHPAVFDPPTARAVAIEVVDALVGGGGARILTPAEQFWPYLRSAVRDARVEGNDVFDAQIVAVCREHGVDVLLTEDRGFRRFPGLRTRGL